MYDRIFFGDAPIDMIAQNYRYHKSCLDRFLTRRPVKTPHNYEHRELSTAYMEWLITKVNHSLFRDKCIHSIDSLTDRVNSWLQDHNSDIHLRNRVIKDRLLEHYMDRIQIIPQKGKSSLICSSELTIVDVLQKVKELSTIESDSQCCAFDSQMRNESNDIRSMFTAAKLLRSKLKCLSKDSNQDEVTISCEHASHLTPNELYNFMAWLVTDANEETEQNGRVLISSKKHETVVNLSQDVMAVFGIPTPKHIGLGLHILKQTRSKDIVTSINRFGNCISYTDSQRIIATEAERVQRQIESNGCFVPSNIKPGHFTHFAIDNLDFSEHRKDGQTTHGTTHIIYQHKDECEQSSNVSVPLSKTRKPSTTAVQTIQNTKSMLTIKDRQNARSVSGLRLTDYGTLSSRAQTMNIKFKVLQLKPTPLFDIDWTQLKSISWKKFHCILHREESPQTVIGYGPFHPRSPTQPDVVKESVD